MDQGEERTEAGTSLRRELTCLAAYSLFTYPFACVPLLFFFYLERGMGRDEYAALASIYYASMVLCELPTGWLADRFGRRTTMVAGPLFLAAGFGVLWAARDFATFAAGEVLFGLGHALLSGPPSALLFERLLERGRAGEYLRFESRLSTIRGLGTALAFLAGGLLAYHHGLAASVLLTACLCLVAAFVALFLHEPRHRRADAGTEERLLPRLARVYRRPGIPWLLFYYVLLFFLLRYAFHTQQPWLLEQGLEHWGWLGVLYCSLALAGLPVTWFTPWLHRRLGERALMLVQPAIVALTLVGLAQGRAGFLVALFYVQQWPFGMHWPLVHAYANHRLDSRDRALVLSSLSFTGRIGFAVLFPLLFGEGRRLDADFLGIGLVSLALALLLSWRMPRGGPRMEA
ncbi:MAG: MFS transporter [Planctomycetota bacterium]